MDKEQVIKVRNALKCGKNRPLRITVDDEVMVIDEHQAGQFVKWNDDEGLLFHFLLPNLHTDRYATDIQGCVSVRCVSYNSITAIEVPYVPVTDFDSLFETMESETNTSFTSEWQDYIKELYKKLLNPNKVTLSPVELNQIHKAKVVDDTDDYYHGRFANNFQETRRYDERNALVDERRKEALENGTAPWPIDLAKK